MRLIYLMRHKMNPVFLSFLIVTFIVGIAGALQFPTLSRFLTDEVETPGLWAVLAGHVEPKQFWVGLFYSVSAVITMVVSYMLALRSDRMKDRKKLILFCCIVALMNTVLFAFSRHYFLLMSVGLLLVAIGNNIMPQLFALAREYTERSARDAVMFSSIMRAQMSLAWVIGPPVSFMLAANYGFNVMYLSATVAFAVGGILIYLLLPSVPRIATPSEQHISQQHVTEQTASEQTISAENVASGGSFLNDKHVVRLFIAMILMWTCNMMYLIDMPIYTDKALHLDKRVAGYLMGLAAGLEIPLMIMAGYYVPRIGKRRLVLLAAIAALCFYGGLFLFNQTWILFVLQLFNALFIGIIAGIGMLYFQDLMPGRAGEATTLFANSATMGILLAGVLQGALSGALGHQSVYLLAVVLIIVAFYLLWRVKDA